MIHRITKLPSRLASLWVAFDAGARSESSDGETFNPGIAHMLEHSIFKGTAKRTAKEINREIASLGGSVNAHTAYEEVSYFVTVPVDNIEKVTEIMSDIIFNSTFPEDEFQREREVVKEEEISTNDGVDSHIYRTFSENFYSNYLANPIIGTQESISNFTRDEVAKFYNSKVKRENAVVSLASSQTKKEAAEMLARHFGKQNGKISRSSSWKNTTYKEARLVNTQKEGIEHSYVWIAYPNESANGKSNPTQSVLKTILSGGMDSRLFEEVRENRGLVYGISSSSLNYQGGGCYLIDFSTRDKNVEEAIDAISSELKKISTEYVSDEELQRAKNKYRASYYSMMESSLSIASSTALRTLFDDVPTEKVIESINSMTKESIIEEAAKLFSEDKVLKIICKKG